MVEGTNGNRPGQFVRAWRHVHDIFTAEHATNVNGCGAPWPARVRRISTSEYPGDSYVDVLGLSGFNGGTRAALDRLAQLPEPLRTLLSVFASTRPE